MNFSASSGCFDSSGMAYPFVHYTIHGSVPGTIGVGAMP